MPVAGRERARSVPDLDQVAEPVAGLVAVRFKAVVALQRGHRVQAYGELAAAGQGERPGAEVARGSRAFTAGGEGPGADVIAEATIAYGAGATLLAGEAGEGGGGDGQVEAGGEREVGRGRSGLGW